MRALLWLITLFALAVGVAMVANANEGFVIIVFPPWRAQLSLNLLIVLLSVGFVCVYFILRLILRTVALPRQMAFWRQRQRKEKASLALREALKALFEGRFAQAVKSASRAFSLGDHVAVAALVAARAAHAMRDETRYRIWLGHAMEQGEETRVARLMTEAELAIDERNFVEAAECLERLKLAGHRNIAALRLSLKVAVELRQWEDVLRLTRQLYKHKALSAEQAQPVLCKAHIERMRELTHDHAALEEYWKSQPSEELRDRRLIECVTPLLVEAGCVKQARRTLERLLDDEWDSNLVRLYGYCGEDRENAVVCLAKAEGWLKRHPKDAGLLYALGRLCVGAQLWGKAQSYLEASLNLSPSVQAHLALAHLLEGLGQQQDKVLFHYRAAAEMVASKI